MPKRVPPETLFDPELSCRWPEVSVEYCLSPVRKPPIGMTACENPIVWLSICGLFFPYEECFADEGWSGTAFWEDSVLHGPTKP